MQIALAQSDFHVGNFNYNVEKIISTIKEAKNKGADIVVFPEMSIPGYPPRDFLQFKSFTDRCYDCLKEIAACCTGISAVIGCPEINKDEKGKPLYNSAFVIEDGKIKAIARKTLLPDYDVFDEYRYFEPNNSFNVVEIKGLRVALTICEDLWNVSKNPLYITNPMEKLAGQKPDIIINIAASPFNYKQDKIRKEILSANAKKYNLPVVYVNQTGAQTELIFDGGSMVISPEGKTILHLPFFEESIMYIDTDEIFAHDEADFEVKEETALIHDALILGIKDYFKKMGFSKAILGLSGGIDSAVCLVLAAKALSPENVRAVLMPSEFSSGHSVDDAKKLAENLGCKWDIIPITNIYNSFIHSLDPLFCNLPFNITEENIQARSRAVLLMALSNKFGYILLNTSNKSEAAVGYGTLYGDMCGGLSVIGDIYKTKVYELAQYINSAEEIIPVNTIIKPPSAELRPGQKDSDSLPEYSVLDKVLYQYIEEAKGPEDIIKSGFDKEIVTRILNLVNSSEYKRFQAPPILRVSTKAFGMGRRMPIEGKYIF